MSDLFDEIETFINQPKAELYTSSEYEQFIIAFAASRGDEGFTEEELDELFTWLNRQRITETLIGLVLKGLAFIDWNGEEPLFSLSPVGKEIVDERS